MKIHAISGLPRAGSTLLCNILNQNEEFHASTTSVLPGMLQTISTFWSSSIEIKGALDRQKEKTEKRMKAAQLAVVKAWHQEAFDKKQVVFDKSRAWAMNSLVFRYLFPEALMIVCVRDLRNIFSSIEKQNKKNPLVDEAQNWMQKGELQRADAFFSDEGIIGFPLNGIQDLIRRRDSNTFFVKYEDLAAEPEKVMKSIYKKLGIKYFKHDFEDIPNTADDPDGLYLHKYPHDTGTKVVKPNLDEWKEHLSEETAGVISNRFAGYSKTFGYAAEEPKGFALDGITK